MKHRKALAPRRKKTAPYKPSGALDHGYRENDSFAWQGCTEEEAHRFRERGFLVTKLEERK